MDFPPSYDDSLLDEVDDSSRGILSCSFSFGNLPFELFLRLYPHLTGTMGLSSLLTLNQHWFHLIQRLASNSPKFNQSSSPLQGLNSFLQHCSSSPSSSSPSTSSQYHHDDHRKNHAHHVPSSVKLFKFPSFFLQCHWVHHLNLSQIKESLYLEVKEGE